MFPLSTFVSFDFGITPPWWYFGITPPCTFKN
jgi:hypothetical protein